jgi:exonuclease VII small subunit
MDEALILEKLDKLTEEVQSLKSGVLDELKQDLQPIIKQTTPHVTSFLADVDGQYSNDELFTLLRKLLSNLDNFNSALDMMKAGMELKDDVMPIIQQIMPKVTTFLGEVDGQYSNEELVALLRKLLSNMDNFNSALDMMKAGMELKDDAMPIIQQVMPKITTFLGEVDGQ